MIGKNRAVSSLLWMLVIIPSSAWAAEANIDSLTDVTAYAKGCYALLGDNAAESAKIQAMLEPANGFVCINPPRSNLLPTELGGVKQDGMAPTFPKECDNPAWLDDRCYGNSYIQQLPTGSNHVSAVLLCRHKAHWTDNSTMFDDIAMIVHDYHSGNTCWFQAPDGEVMLNGNNIPPPSKDVSNFWLAPSATASVHCVGCHDNGAFMHSPWMNKADRVPSNGHSKYKNPGLAFSGWATPTFVSVGNKGLGISAEKCTFCHWISANIYSGKSVPAGVPRGNGANQGTFGRWLDWTTGAGTASRTSALGRTWARSGWMPALPGSAKSSLCYPRDPKGAFVYATKNEFDVAYGPYLKHLKDCQDAVGTATDCKTVALQLLPPTPGPLFASMTATVISTGATFMATATEINNPVHDWQWGTVNAAPGDMAAFVWDATGASYCVVEATFPDGVVLSGVSTASNWTTANGIVEVGPFTVAGTYMFDISCDGQPPDGEQYVDPATAAARVVVVVGAAGQPCSGASDCVSGDCQGGVCQPTCFDGVPDGSETDIDCGGGACAPCRQGRWCSVASDCESFTCSGGVCQASCSDMIQDGGETDIDCGGPCAPCWDLAGCAQASDCQSGFCPDGVCRPMTCADGIFDGFVETGVDCGNICPPCAAGQGCIDWYNCKSEVCANGVCQASCNDGLQDGSETDVDCGGSCSACVEQRGCKVASDCKSKVCTGGFCVATCTDGIWDGTETDVDCGGTCTPCAEGQPCFSPADCQTGFCVGSVCGSPEGGFATAGAGEGVGGAGGGAGSGGSGGTAGASKGCACEAASSSPSPSALWLGLGLLAPFGRRRARRDRRARICASRGHC